MELCSLFHALFHGGGLLLLYLGSEFARQKVDEKYHADLVEGIDLDSLIPRVDHLIDLVASIGNHCGSIGSRHGFLDILESIQDIRGKGFQIIKWIGRLPNAEQGIDKYSGILYVTPMFHYGFFEVGPCLGIVVLA